MHRFWPAFTAAAILCVTGCADISLAQTPQTLYSYVDESGVRILTNIPPKGPVQELAITGPPPGSQSHRQPAAPNAPTAYDPIIDKYAGEYRMDPSLIKAMIARESGFNAKAVSPKGARGLMQLMPATAARHGVRDIHDPEENIRGGVKHMRTLMDTFNNDLVLSLAAYNAGENVVQRLGRVPNYRETHEYVRNITRKYGNTSMDFKLDKPAPAPSMFRFTDENGILHLTNLPPVQREQGS